VTDTAVALLAFVAAPVFLWALIHGFRTGTMTSLKPLGVKGERQSQPLYFWSAAAWNGSMFVFLIWGGIALAR
jgi:hypothetical protein